MFIDRWVKDNKWYLASRPMYAGFESIKMPVVIVVLLFLGIFSQVFLWLAAIRLGFHFLYVLKGLRINDIPRFLRSQLNGRKALAHPAWKKRSRLQVNALVIGLLGTLIVSPVIISAPAEASFRLILPTKEQGQAQVSKSREGLSDIPVIRRGVIRQGFGIDVHLEDVMGQLIPQTWDVDFRDPELQSLEISWRSDDMDLIEIMQDIATRYSVAFRYSNRVGVIFIEWKPDGCRTGYDNAEVFRIIC